MKKTIAPNYRFSKNRIICGDCKEHDVNMCLFVKDHEFCRYCGGKMRWIRHWFCGNCGNRIDPNVDVFCKDCGTKVGNYEDGKEILSVWKRFWRVVVNKIGKR